MPSILNASPPNKTNASFSWALPDSAAMAGTGGCPKVAPLGVLAGVLGFFWDEGDWA